MIAPAVDQSHVLATHYHELQHGLQEQQARLASLTTASDHAETRIAALQERKAELLHQTAQGRDVGEELAALRSEIAELQAAGGDQAEVKARLVEEIAETEKQCDRAAHDWRSARGEELKTSALADLARLKVTGGQLCADLMRCADQLREGYALQNQQYHPHLNFRSAAETIHARLSNL